jgi:pimeloyl-ACP methyl ester carboxylesterase
MTAAEAQDSWSHRRAKVNGVELHYVDAGSGPLVLFLHGFPEFWYSWRHQLAALAAAGFRAVAPDLRGYNESDKPVGVDHYRMSLLVADVAGLVEHLGGARAVIVGHDWGGAIAWRVAMDRPEIVEKLIVLNAPHPAAFRRELRTLGQWLRSSYMLFFRLPWLPEWALQAGAYAMLKRVLRRQPVHAGAFSKEDIDRYKKALAQPGALTATLNYYRAAFRHRLEVGGSVRPIQAPTLLIWGERDPYLGVRLTEGLEPWVPALRVVRIPDASHWVQNDVPERVNELILGFLSGPADGA